MSSDDWVREIDKMLLSFDDPVMASLMNIQRCFDRSERSFNEDFRKYFLKVSNERLASIYSKFELVNIVGVSSRADRNRSQQQTHVTLNATQHNGFVDVDGPSKSMNQMEMVNVSHEARKVRKKTPNESTSPIEIIDSSDDESTTAAHGSNKPLHRSVGKSLGGGQMIKEEEDPIVVKDEVVTNDDDIPMVEYEVNQEENPSSSVDDTVNGIVNGESNPNAEIIGGNTEPVASKNASSSRLPTNNKTTKDNGNAVGAQRSSAQKIKRYKCQCCEFGTQYKWSLTVHMRTHTGETPYSCKYCEKRFKRKSHLQKHIATHKKRFPFHCPGCFSVFKREADKVAHEKTCTNRRYECYWCKKFITHGITNLKEHMRQHTGERPFRCEICMRRFRRKENLKIHLNGIHGKKKTIAAAEANEKQHKTAKWL